MVNGIQITLVKHFGYKLKVKYNGSALLVEQNNYAVKICLRLYCLWFRCLDKKSYKQFCNKNYFFGASNIKKDSDKLSENMVAME